MSDSSERRRREAVVQFGRQQIQLMEQERELGTAQWKINQLLARSQDLESRLEELDRGKQKEQLDPGKEAARRQTVVKVWKLQVKAMERQRQLQRMKRETEDLLELVKATERQMELEENKILTSETSKKLIEENRKNLQQIGKGLEQLEHFETDDQRKQSLRETIKEVKAQSEQVWGKMVSQRYKNLLETTVEVEVDPKMILARLQEVLAQIQQDEEEADTLR